MRGSRLNSFAGIILAAALCIVFFSTAQGQSDWQYEPALESTFVTVPNIDVDALNQEYGLKIRSLAPSELAIGNLDKEEGKEIVVAESSLPLIYVFRNGLVEYYLLENSLSRQRTSPTQPAIESLALGDLNNDGRDEIVVIIGAVGPSCALLVLSYLEGHIQVMWERRFDSHAGAQIGAIAVADLNGDGLTDLVTCGGVFYQHVPFGFGNFAPFPGTYKANGESNDVKVSDLNGDGFLDLVRSFVDGDSGGSGFEILFQEMPGVFKNPIRYWVPYATGGIAVGDVNNDGLKDIVVPEYKTEGHLVVFLQSSGGFQAPAVYGAYENPASPLVTDINGDGLMDVILLNSSWNRIAVFYQSKGGGLNPVTLYTASVGYVKARALQAEDLDGDGNPDLVCIGADDELLCGVTGLPQSTQMTHISASPSPSVRYLPLLATYKSSYNYLLLSLRQTFSDESHRLVIDVNPYEIALGDIDGDGTKEIIVCDAKWPVVYVRDGSEVSLYDLGVSPGWRGLVSLAVGDFSGDTRDDVAVYVGDTSRGTIIILTQASNGRLVKMKEISANKPLGGLATADLNHDGLDDIVTAVGAYYQLPSHAFSAISLFSDDYAPSLTDIVDVEVIDLNSDGYLDVVRASVHKTFSREDSRLVIRRTAGFEVFLQTDTGDFEPPVFYEALQNASLGADPHIAVGDVNHDTAADVVLSAEGGLYVFLQHGGTLGKPIEHENLEDPEAPIITDINGDGLNDIVVCNDWDSVSVLYQDEQGCLGSPVTYTASVMQHPGPEALSAGDIDGDGRTDLVSVANYHYGVCVVPHCALVEPAVHTEDDKRVYWQGVLGKSVKPIAQALALRKLGDWCLSRGEYEKALEYARKGVQICQEAGLRFSTAFSLNDEGAIYFLLGLYGEAFARWEQALTLFNDLDDDFGQRAIYRNLGLLYFLQRNFTSALEYWSMCYKIDVRMQETLAVPIEQRVETRAVAIELNNIAAVQALTGEHEQSLRTLSAALGLSREVQDKPLEAAVLGNLGMVYSMMERYDDALGVFSRALGIIEEETSPQVFGLLSGTEIRWMIEFNIGLSFEERDQLSMAVSHYKKAITLIESMRQSLSHEVFKAAYQQKTKIVYEHLIKLLIEHGQGSSAFPYAERCRARTFLDALYQGSIKPNDLISPETGISSGAVDPKAIDAAVKDARESLQPNEAVLEYFVTQDGIYLWAITKDGISDPIFIEYEREQLMNDVITLRKNLESASPDVVALTTALTSFYTKLVQPGLDELSGKKIDTLILIPSGPLWYLPFSALQVFDQEEGTTRYLIERYTIAYLPSLASLPSLTREREETQLAGEPVLALADPEVSEQQLQEGESSKCVIKPLARYPGLVKAAQAFADELVGKRKEEGCVYAGAQAQEGIAYDVEGEEVEVYAAHGQFNPKVPLQSKLLLAPAKETSIVQSDSRVPDGNYHAWEVLLTDHRGTELVVLAACESLLPHLGEMEGTMAVLSNEKCNEVKLTSEQLEQIVVGDEVVGLARAFLSSGAEAVLGTLWLANPDAIGEVLTSMADYHNQGSTWVQALTRAQRDLVKNPRFSNPWFWAPYQLIGRWR